MEKRLIEYAIKPVNTPGKYKHPVVKEVLAFTTFYEAKKYHQGYIKNHPNDSYVMHVNILRFENLKRI